MKNLIIHLVSDSSGQTVKQAAKSAMSQFSDIITKEYHWPMIRNQQLLVEVLDKIKTKPGIVLYTISNLELRDQLKKFCWNLKIPAVSVVGKIVTEIANYLDIDTDEANANYGYKLNADYFDKVDAIDFALRHDDGQMTHELESADIVLIGPSRTSKTPTSVYLAYNGFKTANIPYVHDCPFPDNLEKLKFPLIVGLIINPSRLVEIRETRMNLLQARDQSDYTDLKIVQSECLKIKRMCEQHNWPVVDVSRRSIEETAAVIMKLFYNKKRHHP